MLLSACGTELRACALENSDPLSTPDICYACCASQQVAASICDDWCSHRAAHLRLICQSVSDCAPAVTSISNLMNTDYHCGSLRCCCVYKQPPQAADGMLARDCMQVLPGVAPECGACPAQRLSTSPTHTVTSMDLVSVLHHAICHTAPKRTDIALSSLTAAPQTRKGSGSAVGLPVYRDITTTQRAQPEQPAHKNFCILEVLNVQKRAAYSETLNVSGWAGVQAAGTQRGGIRPADQRITCYI
jgi:hypothetical protein